MQMLQIQIDVLAFVWRCFILAVLAMMAFAVARNTTLDTRTRSS